MRTRLDFNMDGLKIELHRGIVLFEVVLLLLSSFAFSYAIGEMTPGGGESNFFSFGNEVFEPSKT